MNKLLSLTLTLSFIVLLPSISVCALAPTNYDNVECINLMELGKTKDLVMLGQCNEKVCGCKKCTVDAVMYNRLGDYIDELTRRFNELLKEPEVSSLDNILSKFGSTKKRRKIIEKCVKLQNIESILKGILSYENNSFTNVTHRNFLLASTNYDPNDPTTIIQLAKMNNITYKVAYDENYFDSVKKEKILPFLTRVSAKLKECIKN